MFFTLRNLIQKVQFSLQVLLRTCLQLLGHMAANVFVTQCQVISLFPWLAQHRLCTQQKPACSDCICTLSGPTVIHLVDESLLSWCRNPVQTKSLCGHINTGWFPPGMRSMFESSHSPRQMVTAGTVLADQSVGIKGGQECLPTLCSPNQKQVHQDLDRQHCMPVLYQSSKKSAFSPSALSNKALELVHSQTAYLPWIQHPWQMTWADISPKITKGIWILNFSAKCS